MNKLEVTKQKIQNLNTQMEDAQKELKEIFIENLTVAFKANPQVNRLEMYINNHEFNDGDETYFSINYEDLILITTDETGNEYEFNGYDKKASQEQKDLRRLFVNTFSEFGEVLDWENIFGAYFESICFRFENNKLVWE